jgi:hypothetical protein
MEDTQPSHNHTGTDERCGQMHVLLAVSNA